MSKGDGSTEPYGDSKAMKQYMWVKSQDEDMHSFKHDELGLVLYAFNYVGQSPWWSLELLPSEPRPPLQMGKADTLMQAKWDAMRAFTQYVEFLNACKQRNESAQAKEEK